MSLLPSTMQKPQHTCQSLCLRIFVSTYVSTGMYLYVNLCICDHVYVSMCMYACISLPVIASHYHQSGNRNTFVGLTPRESLPPPAPSLSPSPEVKG